MIFFTRHPLRSLRTAWLSCIFLSIPTALFLPSHDGRFLALCCFLAGCAAMAAASFHRPPEGTPGPSEVQYSWARRVAMASLAMLPAWALFSAALIYNAPHDFIAPVLALGALLASLCIAPFYAMTIGKPLPSVVFTLFSVGAMKLAAGTVNALVHGWHADTAMLWTHPNTITWSFLLCLAILSATFFLLTLRRFPPPTR